MTELDPHFFRHEYGRLVALLTRRAGLRHLDAVEDAVQSALLAALENWPKTRVPENPSAWLFRTASNHFIDEQRSSSRRRRFAEQERTDPPSDSPTVFLSQDVTDDLLRMLFACCDESIPIESQLVFALKTLCGFAVPEIAERLFITETNVYKRLTRARARLREIQFDPAPENLSSRLSAVHSIVYLLFTEGHLSSHAGHAIRRELCDEAIRLTRLLAEHPSTAVPETFALLSLMYLHAARMTAREDGSGGLLLLEEQNRSLWGQEEIQRGLFWLARSAEGDVFSRYHAEAAIAAEHCVAPSFATTRWDHIVECYELLERTAPSPLHTLNRAIATAEWRGGADGLAVLEGLEPPSWLAGSYLWFAALADLHRRCGHDELAQRYREIALESAPSEKVRALLERRLRSA